MKSKLTQFIFGIAAFTALLLSFSPLVLAQQPGTTPPIINPPANTQRSGGFIDCGNDPSRPCNVSDLFRIFIVIINYLIDMAGFIAVLAIVISAFQMVVAGGNEGALRTAKGRLAGAIVGIILVAAAFVLVNAIFSGSFSLGLQDGAQILTSPRDYINNYDGN